MANEPTTTPPVAPVPPTVPPVVPDPGLSGEQLEMIPEIRKLMEDVVSESRKGFLEEFGKFLGEDSGWNSDPNKTNTGNNNPGGDNKDTNTGNKIPWFFRKIG